jgi:chemotaxis family two-component system sensor kinase Cph1
MTELLDLDSLLASCDREPIHVPEAIQPHGLLAVFDPAVDEVVASAGDFLALAEPTASALARLLDEPLDQVLRRLPPTSPVSVASPSLDERRYGAIAHRSGEHLVLEFERSASAMSAAAALSVANGLTARLETAQNLAEACRYAAEAVHALSGYERVMVYRFLADNSGAVLAEARDPGVASLLHHRFPESDIPAQARALYARNHVRVIPNSTYEPSPLEWRQGHRPDTPLDMSDCHLRSVSPIHLQYLRNMGVVASASVSIMVGGKLWGLIACHHDAPRQLDFVEREMCKHVGQLIGAYIGSRERLSEQIEITRLGQSLDEALQILTPAVGSVEETVLRHASELVRAIPADGVAVCLDARIEQVGATPPAAALRALIPLLHVAPDSEIFVAHALGSRFPEAAEFAAQASGALSILVRGPHLSITWFRAEQVETVNWAGNPHKQADGQAGVLTPRKSFDLWSETVHQQSREWSPAEIDAAARLRDALAELLDKQELRRLNRQLRRALDDKEKLVAHKDLLMREVHHRVQNSLQLVNSMLYLQERDSGSDEVRAQFEMARQRLTAVAMVHRRLWRTDKVGDVRLDTFMAELSEELAASWDPRWRDAITQQLAPITLSTDKSILLGLIVTELLTNAVKYAYAGEPGPILIEGKRDEGGRARLVIADRGSGSAPGQGQGPAREGFGSRLVQTLVQQLGGLLEREDNAPGLRIVLRFPIED